jgi:hypothetical protein
VDQVGAYHRELVSRLRAILGDDLVGVYAGGSFALGDYRHGTSDLDVAVVVRARLDRETKDAVVDALRHESLPCPARGLELVVYSPEPGFELNLNTGARMDFRAEVAPGSEWHWFPIDRAILRQSGVALAGPPAQEVFAEIPRSELLAALAEGARWHGTAEPAGANTVLNALRTLHFVREGDWVSKSAAAKWALADGIEPELARQALEAQAVDPTAARRLLDRVEAAVADSRTS